MSDRRSLGQVLGVGLDHSVGPDLNLTKEIRLPVGWSRCVRPFSRFNTPTSPMEEERWDFPTFTGKLAVAVRGRKRGWSMEVLKLASSRVLVLFVPNYLTLVKSNPTCLLAQA